MGERIGVGTSSGSNDTGNEEEGDTDDTDDNNDSDQGEVDETGGDAEDQSAPRKRDKLKHLIICTK